MSKSSTRGKKKVGKIKTGVDGKPIKNPRPGRGEGKLESKLGAGRFWKGGKPTKAQMGKLRALAACGVNLRTIADYFGVDRKTLIQKVDDDENLRKIYRAGQADLKETILSKAIEQVNKGNTAMIIFLMKALCGLTEKGDREDEARERAATIREMVDRLDEGKGRFKVGPDGMIIDPLATPPPPPKKKKGVKSRVVRRGKGKR